MSALGQKQTFRSAILMSAFRSKQTLCSETTNPWSGPRVRGPHALILWIEAGVSSQAVVTSFTPAF